MCYTVSYTLLLLPINRWQSRFHQLKDKAGENELKQLASVEREAEKIQSHRRRSVLVLSTPTTARACGSCTAGNGPNMRRIRWCSAWKVLPQIKLIFQAFKYLCFQWARLGFGLSMEFMGSEKIADRLSITTTHKYTVWVFVYSLFIHCLYLRSLSKVAVLPFNSPVVHSATNQHWLF